jgi:methionyl-tRNA formyltransferase
MATDPRRQRIIFAGTPEFAVPALERLVGSGYEVVAVLTQPDRPAGRGLQARPSPVKTCALARGIEVLQPASLKRDAVAREAIRERRPDLMVVVAYGLILPAEVLAIPRCGCINIHASLLPRWRGAAPIQAAILAGDAQTGITIMQMEEGLDTGPILATRAVAIAAGESAGELHDRLAVAGAGLLLEVIDAVLAGTVQPVAQPSDGVTYAARISKSDARLRWAQPAVVLDRLIRAYNPWPVAETTLDGSQLRCWAAVPLAGMGQAAAPGAVVGASPAGIDVQTGDGLLRLTSVQLAGHRRIDAGRFANGYPLHGKVLGA